MANIIASDTGVIYYEDVCTAKLLSSLWVEMIKLTGGLPAARNSFFQEIQQHLVELLRLIHAHCMPCLRDHHLACAWNAFHQ